MAEEQRPRPPLTEIPSRPLRSLGDSADDEGKILALIKSIKENLDVKMLALRKDLDRQTHDEIAREINKIKEEMDKIRSSSEDSQAVIAAKISGLSASLMERIDARIASLKQDVEAKASNRDEVEIARIREELEAGRADGQLARAALAARIESLSVKIDAIAAAPTEEVARIKQSVEASLKQVQHLVNSFDMPLFVNEIRQLYSEKVAQAEEKIKSLTAQVTKLEQENEQLKRALGEKDLELARVPGERDRDDHQSRKSVRPAIPVQHDQPVQPVHEASPRSPADARPERSPVASPRRDPPVASPRAKQLDSQAETGFAEEVPLGDTDAGRRVLAFCINCGRPRPRPNSRYCVYCGTEYI